jgi:hypothetical protein
MIIALRKDLEVGNTGLTVNHWVVTRVANNILRDVARIDIIGYASRADRVAGKDEVSGANYQFVLKNIPAVLDENDVEVTPADNVYNRFNNYSLSAEELVIQPDPKQRHFLKYATLNYLRNEVADFSGALEE